VTTRIADEAIVVGVEDGTLVDRAVGGHLAFEPTGRVELEGSTEATARSPAGAQP